MRRLSRGKQRKSGANSDGEEEVSGSVKTDNDETGSGNDVEAPNSIGKKRNARGRVKTSEENQVDDKEEAEGQENGKPTSKRRKKDNDENVDSDKVSDDETEKPVNKKKKSKQQDKDSDKLDSDEETEKPVSKKKRGKQDKDSDKSYEEKKNVAEENGKSDKGKKKGKAVQKEDAKVAEEEEDEDEEYEVEKIIDQRTIKGRRQFLVRWKGYAADSDTWENDKELNCDRLIEEFLAEQEDQDDSFENDDKDERTEKKTKGKKQDKKSKKAKKPVKAKYGSPKQATKNKEKEKDADDDDEDEDDTAEYEVEKIIEVHFKKDKKREFLIRWKGFSAKSDTWEPEEHLNCPELINKFMEKLEKIKNMESRELRMNPSHTKRYTLTMHADKRQSRRNADKQRVTYHEYDA